MILWFTGLSGAGKTTLAISVCDKLKKMGYNVRHLDGDDIRSVQNSNLGFSNIDRDRNIKIAIGIASKYCDNGYIVVASFISPYKKHREWANEQLDDFIEVFVDSPLEICEERDVKGLYKKARSGEILFFTGISDPYEAPENPDIHLDASNSSLTENTDIVISYLKNGKYI